MVHIESDTDIGMNRNSSNLLGMSSYPILSPGMTRTSYEKMLRFKLVDLYVINNFVL